MRKKDMRKRRSSPQKIQKLGDVLQAALNRQAVYIDLDDPLLIQAWRSAVGPQIAARTSPGKIRHSVLSVTVSSSVWLQELQFMKQDILEQLNQQTLKEPVTDIRFSVGVPASPPLQKTADKPIDFSTYRLKEADTEVIEKSLKNLSDSELKDILKRVMTKAMIRNTINGNRKGS
jgi:hypothetical protein